jgi:pyrroline-5-carboxylate reductase
MPPSSSSCRHHRHHEIALKHLTSILSAVTTISHLKVIPNGTKTVKEIPNFNVTKGRIVTIHINEV